MKKIDLTGQRFGRLTVIRQEPRRGRNVMWLCQCDCGTLKVVNGAKLRNSLTVSCGCHKKELFTKHSKSHTRLYTIWGNMKQRCGNPKNTLYPRYGGRVIKVCQEWADSFEAFYKWAMAHGYADNLQIDRIDNNQGYFPDNCRWVTPQANMSNTRINLLIEFEGETHTASEWSRITGIPVRTIISRYHAGRSPAEILKTE